MKNSKQNTPADSSRRSLLKAAAAGMLAAATVPLLGWLPSAHAAAAEKGKAKIAVVYYSRTGNTQEIANQIQARVGGDSIQVQTVAPYPEDYNATTKQARQELDSGYKPPLRPITEDIGAYEVIFIGSPNWWGTIAPALMTFLSQHDLSGKIIIPFITHEGSALGQSVTDIRSLCPNATVRDGLAVRGRNVKNAGSDVAAWLRKLEMAS